MYFTTASTETANSNKSEPKLVQLNNRYRPRDTGVGYGKSSGYASNRRYASAIGSSLVRVR